MLKFLFSQNTTDESNGQPVDQKKETTINYGESGSRDDEGLRSKFENPFCQNEFGNPNKDGSHSKKSGLTRNRSSFFMMSGELTANLTYESAYASDAETIQKRR